MSGIYWIASYPKSGNTWIRLIIAAVTHETGDLCINSKALCPMVAVDRDLFDELLGVESSEFTPTELLALRPAMLHTYMRDCRAPLIAKTHDARLPAGDGVNAWCDDYTLGGVYLLRDPRDVAVSLARHMGRSLDAAIEQMATPSAVVAQSVRKFNSQLPEVWSSWSGHVESWTGRQLSGVQIIRYEDLRAEPAKRAALALAALGIAVEGPVLERALEMTRLEQLRQQEEQFGFVEAQNGRFFGEGLTGGWKKVLSPSQVRKIEADHGTVMRRFGYL